MPTTIDRHLPPPTPPAHMIRNCRATPTGSNELSVHVTDVHQRIEIAEWYLRNGYQIANPFAHVDDAVLTIRHAPAANERRRWVLRSN